MKDNDNRLCVYFDMRTAMKEIIFDSDDLQDLDKIAEKLFMEEDAERDPTSIYYKRQLQRF